MPVAPAAARGRLTLAHERATRLLGRRTSVRRAELAEGLQELAEAVAAAIEMLANKTDP